MLKTVLLTAAGILLFYPLWAFQADTIRLREVAVYGIPQQKFAVGHKVEAFDSLEIARQQSSSISDLLIRKSPIYFKEYGPGMLSTISFRGTSPNHTAVLWNGLNLNAPNLGQTDFSLIPLFAIEELAVQYGGSSALWGSDAIGGAIHLQSRPQWNKELHLKLQQEIGSFGRYFTGVAAKAGFQNWSLTSKAYLKQADNDFHYINTNKKGHPLERNRNARFEQKGLVQNLAYRFSGNSNLSLNSWYQHTYRQIQPPLGDLNSQDQQENKNMNLSLRYRNNSSLGFFDVQLGHLYAHLLYNRGSEYSTWQNIANLRYEKRLSSFLQLQLGGKLNSIKAAIAQYPDGSAKENRSDLFASLRFSAAKKIKASLNLRQAFITGYTVPFTPSAGLEYSLYQGNTSSMQWLVSGGRNYRVPTLNDRYWQYAGKPDLKPENAWNTETTLRYQYRKPSASLEVSTTAYHMWVDNWILWLPGTVAGPQGKPISSWTPQNIQEVNSKGLELAATIKGALPAGRIEAGGNLAYTRSINMEAKHTYDRTVGRQLPFIPLIKWNTYLTYTLDSWFFTANWSHTGIRYTSGEELEAFSIPAFRLLDSSVGRSFSIRKHTLNLQFDTRNLLNKQYQNYENRAMPGRSYNLSIKYLFNQPL